MTRAALVLAFFFGFLSLSYAQSDLRLEAGGGEIDVSFISLANESSQKLALNWINTSAHAVVTYYKRFPVPRVQLKVRWFDGTGVRGGRTTGWNGPVITISVGRANTASDFADDWMLTHEFVHLAFPSVPEENHWIEEGLSTYVEPIARAYAGDLTSERVWSDLVDGLPQGLPGANDRGLDFTPTWGRTYWGGALFCLLADVEIRKRTANKKGLPDALRAILQAGGTIESDWALGRALEIGDRATGTQVLRELYDKMKASPAPVDLPALWRELGIEPHHGRVSFNDSAPLASVRKAITRPQ